MNYRVKLTVAAAGMLRQLHPEIRKSLKAALRELGRDPWQGKVLLGELSPCRSLKLKRYRVVYLVDEKAQEVKIVALGHRRDIYDTTGHILRDSS